MKKIILILFMSSVVYGQDSTHFLCGKWLESDPVITDSTFSFDVTQLYFDDWEYEFFTDGTYIQNSNDFCDGKEFSPTGKWIYSSNTLVCNENLVCENSSRMSYTFDMIWITPTMWYECGKEGGYFIIYVYKKIEIP